MTVENRLLVVLLTLGCGLTTTSACHCFPPHIQQGFCESDYALKAQVIEVIQENPENEYWGDVINTVKVLQDYRGLPKKLYRDDGLVDISTTLDSAACGIGRLDPGTIYYLTGYIYEDEMYYDICGTDGKWENMDAEMMNRLENIDCGDCIINGGVPEDACTDEQGDWGSLGLNDDLVCVRNSQGSCEWEAL